MTRIYDNPALRKRSNISLFMLVIVTIYGLWELWYALSHGASDTTGIVFGLGFFGGGLYGLKTTLDDTRDQIAAFDVDRDANKAVITLWRPLKSLAIETRLDGLGGWRHYVKIVGRGGRNHLLMVKTPDYPRELHLEFAIGKPVSDGLRQLAPEPVEDFERETGAARARADSSKASA